ncbi:MAG: DNA-binding domain-containing protein [Pseudomonadota bacterium]
MQATLPELQHWFLTVMTAPGGAAHGLQLAQERFGLAEGDVVRAAPGAPARLHIYADGYILRLLECLHADYPVLRKVMGEELFDFFGKAYIWRHPSGSPTLYDLGAGFAQFLQESQPQGQAGQAQFRFALELARLERARTEAMRAHGLENQPAPEADPLALLFAGGRQLRLAPCTRLLALEFPLHAYWSHAAQLREGEPPAPVPAPAPCFVAVGRQRYRIGMHALQEWQFHYLLAARPGAPAHDCAGAAAEKTGQPVGDILADALLWLPVAAAAGLLEMA